ncbi:MAG: rhodanese-like domain-containing protein, partial [Gammaproteobacteria bacterium]|nr:rhodanese-like domain-containing protein [Gammaproteobacteria bacterium]
MTLFIRQNVNVFLFMAGLVFSANTVAEEAEGPGEVRITKEMPYVDVMHEGRVVRIERIQDEENVLTGGFAKTSRKCPPFCVNPIETAPGVKTVGEIEILQFLQTHVKNNTGLLIDARTSEWFEKGTIPGSVNIPFFVFGKDESDVELQEVLTRLGVAPYKAEPKKESFWDSLMGKKS